MRLSKINKVIFCIFFTFSLFLAMPSIQVHALETAWFSPSAYTNSNNISNPGNLYADDGSNAVCSESDGSIILTNFTINDLTGYAIAGIEVRSELAHWFVRKGLPRTTDTVNVSLFYNSISTETVHLTVTTVDSWQIYNFGNSTYTWNHNWIPSDLTNANFGIKLYILGIDMTETELAEIDYLQCKIYYYDPANEMNNMNLFILLILLGFLSIITWNYKRK